MKKQIFLSLLILCAIVLVKSSNSNVQAYSSDDEKESYTYYGYYPQSLLEDEIIYDSLYFTSLDNAPDVLNWYKYANDYYVKVETKNIKEDVYFSNGDKVLSNRIYFFKVEKIKWKLEKNKDYYDLETVKIIDGSSFYDTETYDQSTFMESSNISSLMKNIITPAIEYNNEELIEYISDSSSIYRDCLEIFTSKVHLPRPKQSQEDNYLLAKEATDYAIARGVTVLENGNTEYWLEMIGTNNRFAIYSTSTGKTFYNKTITQILGIAPCIRVRRGVVS